VTFLPVRFFCIQVSQLLAPCQLSFTHYFFCKKKRGRFYLSSFQISQNLLDDFLHFRVKTRCQALKFDNLVGLVYLVHLVYLVDLVCFVCLVDFVYFIGLVDIVYFVDLVDFVYLVCLVSLVYHCARNKTVQRSKFNVLCSRFEVQRFLELDRS